MPAKTKQEPQNPLILRCHRLMEAFAKSDDERDFYIDRTEGFMVFVDLDKPEEQLEKLKQELDANPDRYCPIPKLTFYETKKIMEGFVNEKVYDIDTKEKLSDIIQSREARENFLEFIYDQHTELEKWQQYYQERSRIRIIEWLRQNHFHFVFEEDLDLPVQLIDKLKQTLFDSKVDRDIFAARKEIAIKSKTYYSNEALNPRPKRGRPPKQAAKLDITLQSTTDIFTTVPTPVRPFLFAPDTSGGVAAIFSSKFTEKDLLENRKLQVLSSKGGELEVLQKKLAELRSLSKHWIEPAAPAVQEDLEGIPPLLFEKEEEPLDAEIKPLKKLRVTKKEPTPKKPSPAKTVTKKAPEPKPAAKKPAKKAAAPKKPAATKKAAAPKKAPVTKKAAAPKKPAATKKAAAPKKAAATTKKATPKKAAAPKKKAPAKKKK